MKNPKGSIIVIPTPYQGFVIPAKALHHMVYRAKAGIQAVNTGFRVKPGMTAL